MKKSGVSIVFFVLFLAGQAHAEDINIVGKYVLKYKTVSGSLDIKRDDKTGLYNVDTSIESGGNSSCGAMFGGSGKLEANVLKLKAGDQEAPDCVVTIKFSKDGKKASMSEDACFYYHGASCSLDGDFTKKK